MDGQMGRLGHMSKAASVVVWVVLAVLGGSLVYSAYVWVTGTWLMNANVIINGVTSVLRILLLMLIAVLVGHLLHSLRREISPFTQGNAKRLNGIALVLVAVAVVDALTAVLPVLWTPALGGDLLGIVALAFQYYTLVLLLLAFVVWCVGLAFQHGAALQQQADETL